MTQAKFSIGQCASHRFIGYRGVIVDVDAVFEGTDEWYKPMAKSSPPRDEPWYHVLVHGADHRTNVAERNLATDDSKEPVLHPLLTEFFVEFSDGDYLTGRHNN